jgi:hypothetical protein
MQRRKKNDIERYATQIEGQRGGEEGRERGRKSEADRQG